MNISTIEKKSFGPLWRATNTLVTTVSASDPAVSRAASRLAEYGEKTMGSVRAIVSVRHSRAVELALEPGLFPSNAPADLLIKELVRPLHDQLSGASITRTAAYRLGLLVEALLEPHTRVLVPASEGGRDRWVQGALWLPDREFRLVPSEDLSDDAMVDCTVASIEEELG